MLFNSLSYLVFFVFVYIVYWQIHHQCWRLAFLLLVSFYFYASWQPAYLLLIIVTIITSYSAALGMSKYQQRKKLILTVTLGVNLGILAVFKTDAQAVPAAEFYTRILQSGTISKY